MEGLYVLAVREGPELTKKMTEKKQKQQSFLKERVH